jgi:UDP-N-acetylglucosamine diphosphorylase/glucosamine-1-phosphate N-acetyltransferase
MMDWILFEDSVCKDFLPLSFTRPVYELRIGIDLIREKWESFMGTPAFKHTRPHLVTAFGRLPSGSPEAIWINGRVIPNAALREAIQWLNPNTLLKSQDGTLLAARSTNSLPTEGLLSLDHFTGLEELTYQADVLILQQVSDLFRLNGTVIRQDFDRITRGRMSSILEDKHTIVYKPENVFIEPGAKIRAAILNAESGPIYIGKDAEIQEGAIIHGTHALCEKSVVNMGAKLRGDSTIGPYCKVGGEVSNTILHSYSNKGHDGFLGNSVIGAWCNLGADTNNSNLKNNYASVKLWNYSAQKFKDTGLMFCGLVMADHSKCGINTMFNTGTVVGVASNIFGDGFPRNFVPDFSWGGAAGFTTHSLPKVFETARKVMERRGVELSPEDVSILEWVFEETKWFRGGVGG